MKLIPLAILTHDRIDHLKICIESILKNGLSAYQDVYVFLDAPCNLKFTKNNSEIVEFINSVKGFNSINLIAHKINVGPHKNFEFAVDYIFSSHDKLIFLEDDIVVAPNFLLFMNNTMNYFSNDPNCYAVSGFSYPLKSIEADIYKSNYLFAWGMGLFKNKYVKYDDIFDSWKRDLISPVLFLRFFLKFPFVLHSMISQEYNKTKWYDACGSFFMISRGFYSVMPIESLVSNIGLDGSGQNCKPNRSLQDMLTIKGSNKTDFIYEMDINENVSANLELRKYFKISLFKFIWAFYLLIKTFIRSK